METIKSIDKREFLIENVLRNANGNHKDLFVEKELSVLRREVITRPVIYIGAGTCGFGAGAAKTIEQTEKFLADNGIDAEVIHVDASGFVP